MNKRVESVISPRNLSVATGKVELPISELEEAGRSRFGSGNSRSYFGQEKFDVPIWHLNGETEPAVGYRSLEFRLQIHFLDSIAYKGLLKPHVHIRLTT